MDTITAEIDTYPLVEDFDNSRWHSHNKVWERLEKKFNHFYGTDYQFNYQL